MSSILDSFGISQLSIPDRVELVHAIWDSIAEEQGVVPLSDAQRDEIDRRLAKHRANPKMVKPWDELDPA